jgi:hypothetical protein
MQAEYFVTQNGVQQGPYTQSQVMQLLKGQKLDWMDYCFDEASGEWVTLMQHGDFADKMNVPQQTISKVIAGPSPLAAKTEKEWFALKDDNRYGPFAYLEIVKMLQDKSLSEHDYIWHEGLPNWAKVAEIEDFSPDRIKALKGGGMHEITEIFFRRRHARAHYEGTLIVHNNRKVFQGHSLEISAGGAGILIDGAVFDVGDSLFLHFRPGNGVPPFNAICNVVNRREIEHGRKTHWRYGVQFTSISEYVQESIEEYAKQAQAA